LLLPALTHLDIQGTVNVGDFIEFLTLSGCRLRHLSLRSGSRKSFNVSSAECLELLEAIPSLAAVELTGADACQKLVLEALRAKNTSGEFRILPNLQSIAFSPKETSGLNLVDLAKELHFLCETRPVLNISFPG
jgi:hypothetical protein